MELTSGMTTGTLSITKDISDLFDLSELRFLKSELGVTKMHFQAVTRLECGGHIFPLLRFMV